jgi:hypothetical protein
MDIQLSIQQARTMAMQAVFGTTGYFIDNATTQQMRARQHEPNIDQDMVEGDGYHFILTSERIIWYFKDVFRKGETMVVEHDRITHSERLYFTRRGEAVDILQVMGTRNISFWYVIYRRLRDCLIDQGIELSPWFETP